jgi:hypothetical protein
MKTQDRAQVASILAHRGEFFRVLQQTSRTPLFFLTVYARPRSTDGGRGEILLRHHQLPAVRLEPVSTEASRSSATSWGPIAGLRQRTRPGTARPGVA